MKPATLRTVTAVRIAIPYLLALLAPLVMAPKFSRAYAPLGDDIPVLTRVLIDYGLFLGNHVWLAVLLAGALVAGLVALAHNQRVADTMHDMRTPLHLIGAFIAIAVVLSFNLPRALTLTQ